MLINFIVWISGGLRGDFIGNPQGFLGGQSHRFMGLEVGDWGIEVSSLNELRKGRMGAVYCIGKENLFGVKRLLLEKWQTANRFPTDKSINPL
ncbi:MAG: hypothetical protein JSW28_01950 [Thermoplasmata archaeon]|nr:MAG: hypothetical protein JSW28_01950 [Thermoplasmata archaeon]